MRLNEKMVELNYRFMTFLKDLIEALSMSAELLLMSFEYNFRITNGLTH